MALMIALPPECRVQTSRLAASHPRSCEQAGDDGQHAGYQFRRVGQDEVVPVVPAERVLGAGQADRAGIDDAESGRGPGPGRHDGRGGRVGEQGAGQDGAAQPAAAQVGFGVEPRAAVVPCDDEHGAAVGQDEVAGAQDRGGAAVASFAGQRDGLGAAGQPGRGRAGCGPATASR